MEVTPALSFEMKNRKVKLPHTRDCSFLRWGGLEEFQGLRRTKKWLLIGAAGGVVGGEGGGGGEQSCSTGPTSLSLIIREYAIDFTVVFTVTTSPAKIPAPESM